MAVFRYRMQNILDIKEKLETQARNDFAVAAAKLAEEEEKLEDLKHRRDGYEQLLKDLYSRELDLQKIKETRDAIDIMKYSIELQIINVKQAEKELDIQRERLKEAMQERKTHDKLKERQFEEFLKEEAAKESKEIDELVSFRHGRDESG